MTKLDVVRCKACTVLVVTWVAAACTQPQSLGIPGRDGGPRTTDGSQNGAPRNFRMDSKRVAAKAPPTTLIAEDGTKCVVGEKKFRDTDVGNEAWCEWRVQ